MPLHRRLPKYGFTNINKIENKAINLSTIEALAAKGITEINNEQLIAAGLISRNDIVKVLGDGKLTAKVNVTVNKFSKSAVAAIEAAGGTATQL
ncbi:LSU ribosomal protein L15p (L27Ae) [Mucinivorans hirudinis]|uniref:50S ribosomal protein L15 n=1 Tax=Mucinivorans hirudinis TaxID=1433126 RepID=A0A060RC76_9BACT|nr:LSU ribosomal protein L15p (L27Ae) [Mucinivorans hirudinis]